ATSCASRSTTMPFAAWTIRRCACSKPLRSAPYRRSGSARSDTPPTPTARRGIVMGHDSTYAADLLDHAPAQRRETGYDVTEIERQRAALGADASAGELLELLDALEELPPPADWPYDEPSERAAIEAWYPTEPESGPTPGDELRDRLAGA